LAKPEVGEIYDGIAGIIITTYCIVAEGEELKENGNEEKLMQFKLQ
jgi:hypothetical protein